ncbi:uncharacterized protein K444DRAFT_625123 [Hyaloscypha bicolor E]|uniref:Thiaminase-2/PQQC domain-containing protein n=1 Tax=Hyaloscypha bicolor E TaxID=1095630 RepID=A0A2J6TR98_9HELO|nr:uncharacterized protein K444DRAFT_625123 [Hyaloscypha bicolor E]PMD65555.1 hypothetical protein K444DRAFT_625123 [Hyaloscypha bicolor E]
MASPEGTPPFTLPKTIASGRVTVEIEHVNLDATNTHRGVQPSAIINTFNNPAIVDQFILKIWNDPHNQDVVQAFLKNDFVWFAAYHTDSEALAYYQNYGIALRLNTVLDDDWENLQKEANSLAESVKWVNNWRDTLITKLKLPAASIDQAERSIGEMAYANVLQRHASIDDWFDLHVIMIPCVWIQIRRQTNLTGNIATIFYETWVKPNLTTSSADKLSSFLDANSEMWAAGIDKGQAPKKGKWNQLFRTAMRLEVELFKSSGYSHTI